VKTAQTPSLGVDLDWYGGTANHEVRPLLELLSGVVGDDPLQHVKPVLKGYAFADKSGGQGGSVWVHYGGPVGDKEGPHVQGTGPISPAVAHALRSASVAHKVSRVDVRQDFIGDFDQCRLAFIGRCNSAGMQSRDAGSCPESSAQLGRTVYGGSTKSVYRPTLYQKGIQLGEGFPVDYLRLEHRFMPSKSEEKAQFSRLTPIQMIGLRPVARDLSETIAALQVKPYKLDKLPKAKTPYHWMLKGYAKVYQVMLEDHGTPEAVGLQIFHDLGEMGLLREDA